MSIGKPGALQGRAIPFPAVHSGVVSVDPQRPDAGLRLRTRHSRRTTMSKVIPQRVTAEIDGDSLSPSF